MCEIAKSQRRAYRDQDPPRITETLRSGRSSDSEDASGNDAKPDADPDFFVKEQQQQQQQHWQQHSRRKEPALINPGKATTLERDSDGSPGRNNTSAGARLTQTSIALNGDDDNDDDDSRYYDKSFKSSQFVKQVPYTTSSSRLVNAPNYGNKSKDQVIAIGVKREEEDSCGVLTNGREMAPVMGVPPPPPPAPHMGPDGLILPKKPYNPCLISNNHKDLRRELLFNQKIGRNVLNQKSELQRALEKQRETKMRKEAEKNREETYKDDPRTALQRALEQRAKHIQLTEQPEIVEPPNPLVNARAKLRTRTDSQ